MKTEQSYTGWYFLIAVVLLYLVLSLVKPGAVISSFSFFWSIIKNIIPIIFFVFILMTLLNYFVKPKHLVKYMGKESGISAWGIAIISGIISTGPIYLWYPMLSDVKKHGVRDGLISAFLYNRAIKPAILPLFIFYFGLKYVAILTVVMIFASVLGGFLVEKIIGVIK